MEAVKSLKLPSCYVEVTDNEMEYLDGNWNQKKFLGITSIVLGAVSLGCAIAATVITAGAASPLTVPAIAGTLNMISIGAGGAGLIAGIASL